MPRVIGLMSGTSLDGVDAAFVETDGERVDRLGARLTLPYDPGLRRGLRDLLDRAAADALAPDDPALARAVAALTDRHAEACEALVRAEGPAGLVGFHGQTLLHRPGAGLTWQVGDAAGLARRLGVPVAHDFRSADVAAGGQGAPLVPVAHLAFAAGMPRPLAVLNLGGVGNVTWIGADDALVAFDTGPANGPLDDWAARHLDRPCDRDGALALAGAADGAVLARLRALPFLAAPPPKSLDRLAFGAALRAAGLETLTPPDGAATLVAFVADTVAAAAAHLPAPPVRWLVAGGGRRNPALMAALGAALDAPVDAAEMVGWDGDALEAQAFAVLAARVARGLPLTFPGTTGVAAPLAGGRIARP